MASDCGVAAWAADWISSAVRLRVSSITISPDPQAERSGGIGVALIHAPLAYAKKSSPGLTARSMPATSSPETVAAAACGGGVVARTRSVMPMKSRVRRVGSGVRVMDGPSVKRWRSLHEPFAGAVRGRGRQSSCREG